MKTLVSLKKLTVIVAVFFAMSSIPTDFLNAQVTINVYNCSDKGGYTTRTRKWKSAYQGCETIRHDICTAYFNEYNRRNNTSITWNEYLNTSWITTAGQYNCKDFSGPSVGGASGGNTQQNPQLESCLNDPPGSSWMSSCLNFVTICKDPQTDEATYFENDCDKILAKSALSGGGGSGSGGSGGILDNPPVGIGYCSEVDASNSFYCCDDTNYATYQQACDNFNNSQPPGTIGGGTQNTNPTGNTGNPGTIAPTPQGSSSALASCNLISFDSLLDILIWLKCIIGAAIIPLIFTIAFVLFLWGMVQYIRNADNEKKREESKKFIYYGIIGLTVMVAVWGIVRIVTTTFGLGDTVPQLQTDCLSTDPKNPCK